MVLSHCSPCALAPPRWLTYAIGGGVQCYGIGPAIDRGGRLGLVLKAISSGLRLRELNRFREDLNGTYRNSIWLRGNKSRKPKANCFNHRGVDQVSIARADRQRSLLTTIF